MNIKKTLSKIIANNPISWLFFFLFKKRLSFNHITIRVISFILNQRIPFHKATIDVSDKLVTPMTKSLLYWGIYEKNEINLVKNHLGEAEDVIELGASIGAVGCVISCKQTTGRYIAVEADPTLINICMTNISLNRKTEYFLLNKAIDYSTKTVSFATGNSTLNGRISEKKNSNSIVTVETITLKEICEIYNIENFTLVSDIEGAEVAFILHDKIALEKCKKMIIELHNTEYNGKLYTVEDIIDLILKNDFDILDQQGNVYVFKNKKLVL